MLVDVVDILSVTDDTDIVAADVTIVSVECITGDCSANELNSEYSILMMQLNHSLDDGNTGLVVVGVAMLVDKFIASSVTVDVTIIVVCTTVSVEYNTVGCSVLAI